MSALDLARLQFGITILLHFLIVALSIGTASCVAAAARDPIDALRSGPGGRVSNR
jgi:hypothetical protein